MGVRSLRSLALLRVMMADDAARRGANQAVMRQVTGCSADNRALEAALCVGRDCR
jgi:hypothetical protein